LTVSVVEIAVFAVEGVDEAAGLMDRDEAENSMVGPREEASEEHSSQLGIGMMSMTKLEDWMGGLERDEGCWARHRGTFTRRWMMLSLTCVFARCPMPFRKGTGRLLRRLPRNFPLLLRERVSCHFGGRGTFGGASGNEETERDMTAHEGCIENKQIYVKREKGRFVRSRV
jgi:hypothetical protein